MSETGSEARKTATGGSEDAYTSYSQAHAAALDSEGPEVVPAGLEVVDHGQGLIPFNHEGKEVRQPEKETVYAEGPHRGAAASLVYPPEKPTSSSSEQKRGKVCGLRPWILWAALASLVLVFGIALGAGLGVGLNNSHSGSVSRDDTDDSTPSSMSPTDTTSTPSLLEIGGTIDPSYYSNKNAWNGSGLSHAWQNLPPTFGNQPGDNQSLVLYYQHPSGDIRWMRRLSSGSWSLGARFLKVTGSAKNSTPISVVRDDITQAGFDIWNVFYIDKNHMVRQRTTNNASQEWSDGSINDLRLSTFEGDLVGLHACWIEKDPQAPLRLWYASDNATFQEYVRKRNLWTREKTWEGYSGAAGVSCYSTGEGDFIYVALINLDYELEIWYQDITNQQSEWEQSDVIVKDVHPASSISLSRYICVLQMRAQTPLWVVAVHWEGNTTSLGGGGTLTQQPMIRGTHFTALADGNDQILYSQAVGNDIEQSQRGVSERNTAWTSEDIAFDNQGS